MPVQMFKMKFMNVKLTMRGRKLTPRIITKLIATIIAIMDYGRIQCEMTTRQRISLKIARSVRLPFRLVGASFVVTNRFLFRLLVTSSIARLCRIIMDNTS